MNRLKILWLLMLMMIISCADSKTFKIDGKDVLVEPYGWADFDLKKENIRYETNVGNVIWSIILVETIVAPVVFTGWYLFEPVELIKLDK
jgi:hypothetical protein